MADINSEKISYIDDNSSQKSYADTIKTHTALVAILTLISRLLGFVRIGVLSAIFGGSGIADMLNLVLSIPNNLRKLLAEGALHNAYMPSYAHSVGMSKKATKESSLLLAELLVWGGMVTLLVVIVFSILSRSIIELFFHIESEEYKVLASKLFYYVIYYLLFVTIAAMLAGILQIHKQFVVPAISPIVMSITVITMTLLFSKQIEAFSVVYGYLLGGILQVILLSIPILFMFKYISKIPYVLRHFFRNPLFSTEFLNILKRYPAISLSVIFPIIGQQIAFYFSSTLPEGSTSAFAYAIVFWQLPIGVVINSIISISYTYILTFRATNKKEEIKTCIEQAIEKLYVCVLPISIMFYFFAQAGISITIQRGNLSFESSILISKVLQFYALGLFPMGLYLFFQKILLAYNKQNLVFAYSIVFTVVDVILSFLLINTSLEVVGLSIAYTISLLIILPFISVYIIRMTGIQFFKLKYLKILVGLVPLLIVSFWVSNYTQYYWISGSNIINIIRFIVLTIVLLSILLLGYYISGINLCSFLKRKRNQI